MSHGRRTRQILENNYTLLNTVTYTKHKYNTRSQLKFNKTGTINICYDSTMQNIQDLLDKMRYFMPGINYCYNIGNILENITISCDNIGFKLSGKNVDMYSFLSSNIGINLLIAISQDNNDPSKQISPEDFDLNFKKIPFNQINKNEFNDTCPICNEKFNENSDIVKTPCNHYYNRDCLKQWLTESCHNPTCPMCRKDLSLTH